MHLLRLLDKGRQDFLEALHGITDQQASATPQPWGWTVLECIEHVVIVENRYLNWIDNGANIEAQPNSEKEMKLFLTIRNREQRKVEAPDAVLPTGRFRKLDQAIKEFEAVRGRSMALVEDRGELLYAIGVEHPYFGSLNAVELLNLADGHARRHADQIREITT